MAVYLLHFDEKIAHAQHYLGFSDKLDQRIKQHRRGKSGAGIVTEFFRRNIGFVVARVWEDGDRIFERHLKVKYKHTTRLCPVCKAEIKAKEPK